MKLTRRCFRVYGSHEVRRICLMVSAGVLFAAHGALADGAFLQFDVSESTGSAVVSINRGALTFGATHVRYEGGRQTTLNALHALPLGQAGPTFRIGPSIGRIESDSEPSETRAGARLVVEQWMPTAFGSLFLLAEGSTIEGTAFALAQLGFTGPDLLLELSHGRSDSYSETTVAVSKSIGEGPVDLRAGYRLDAEELFVGFSINTF